MKEINAKEFNEKYKVGGAFIYQPHAALRGGPLVKTVATARDFEKSGTIVEINKEPFFVKVTSLTAA